MGVDRVQQGSGAAEAGIKTGDLLLKAGRRDISVWQATLAICSEASETSTAKAGSPVKWETIVSKRDCNGRLAVGTQSVSSTGGGDGRDAVERTEKERFGRGK